MSFPSGILTENPAARIGGSRWLTTETNLFLAGLKGMSFGVVLGAFLATAMVGVDQRFGLPILLNMLLLGLLGVAFVMAGDGILSLLWAVLGYLLRMVRAERLLRRLRAVPQAEIGRILAMAIFMYGRLLFPDSFLQNIALPAAMHPVVWTLAVAGALIGVARMPQRARRTRTGLVAVALLLIAVPWLWLLWPGSDAYLAAEATSPATAVAPPALANPGLPGPYAVKTLTYGSGSDRQRDEFAGDASLLTPTVDGTPVFAGYGGLGGAIYNWFWGFDFSQLPLNGRVWLPDGDGPFPLVLIVHGNHNMGHFSDTGYDYLGEHLASRGIITVSVDQNFLNGYMLADGHGAEMPLRAWLLLAHLQQWRAWNDEAATPFSGKVDLQRVGLIGHSRGGEAVAHAAELNSSLYGPLRQVADNGDFDFGIRAVVGLAPSDGQFEQNGRLLVLQHTDYLMLVGGHDADTYTAMAIPTYNRVRFDENPHGFAAMAYLYRANHGQFNTVWANRDYGLVESMLLNRRAYLSGAEQRQAATVLITAFLEASLHSEDAYRQLFRRPQAGADWLPDDLVVTAYKDASFWPVDTSSKGGQPDRIDVSGGTAVATGVSEWKREPLLLRDGETRQDNTALRLAWLAGQTPVYTITLPQATANLTAEDALTFALASAQEEAAPLDVQVELETAVGTRVRLPLQQFGAIHPPLRVQTLKSDRLAHLFTFDKINVASPVEVVLQTYDVLLAAFVAADAQFQPEQLTIIRFYLDGAAGGAVYLDEIGFRSVQP